MPSSAVGVGVGVVTGVESHYVNWPVDAAARPLPPAPARLSLLDASVDNHYEFDTTLSPNETGADQHHTGTVSLITTATARC